MEEFPLKWYFLPLLYHYLSLHKGWKHDSIWFLSFRQRAELLYAFSPLLVVKNSCLCRVKSGVIQRLRKYIKNKSQVLSKSTSNSCIRSKADILTLIQTILGFPFSWFHTYQRKRKVLCILPTKSTLLNTNLKFPYPNKSCCWTSLELEPPSYYFMPMLLFSSS